MYSMSKTINYYYYYYYLCLSTMLTRLTHSSLILGNDTWERKEEKDKTAVLAQISHRW